MRPKKRFYPYKVASKTIETYHTVIELALNQGQARKGLKDLSVFCEVEWFGLTF